uniref:Uncharacterized protein n=1 Tax=Strix occidentalis caurina TaxID=311401 RepID=A0A8D0FSZ6_STROC
MENYPPSTSINTQPYGRNGAGSPATPVPNPQDFVLWSFFNTVFFNAFCLGFIALIFSVKVRVEVPPSHRSPARAAPCTLFAFLMGALITPLPPSPGTHPPRETWGSCGTFLPHSHGTRGCPQAPPGAA